MKRANDHVNLGQTEYSGDLATAIGNKGLSFYSGKPMKDGRSIHNMIRATWKREMAIAGEDAARPIAIAFVDKKG
jgi:hypothetical protein